MLADAARRARNGAPPQETPSPYQLYATEAADPSALVELARALATSPVATAAREGTLSLPTANPEGSLSLPTANPEGSLSLPPPPPRGPSASPPPPPRGPSASHRRLRGVPQPSHCRPREGPLHPRRRRLRGARTSTLPAPPRTGRTMPRSAVVIGAGLAGMLAAAALAPVADTVTVLDRDTLPDEPRPRKGASRRGGTPTSCCPAGPCAMEELVPGAHGQLLAAGAHHISMTSGMVLFTSDGWPRRWRHDGHRLTTCSRDLIDHTVRAAVLARAGVTLRARTQAVRPSAPPGASPGARRTGRRPGGGPARRPRRRRQWPRLTRRALARRPGITGVPEDVVDSGLVNASRIYRVPEGAEGFPLTTVHADPYGGRPWHVRHRRPHRGRPLDGQPVRHPRRRTARRPRRLPPVRARPAPPRRRPARLRCGAAHRRHPQPQHRNGRRRFEKSRLWPDGLVVLGDAVATFNPVYGQGMSVAALGARSLADEVRTAGLAAPGSPGACSGPPRAGSRRRGRSAPRRTYGSPTYAASGPPSPTTWSPATPAA